jgi:threonylcarbamoyladenosine tRNA methylthiotransferase MtaB
VRFRLSSLDPLEVSDTLIETMATSKGVICPFLHLSAQSVDDAVLKAMARRHHVADFEHIVQQMAQILPEAMMSADIIVGFPGESEAAFEATFERLLALPVHHLHVFRYSPRPGTPAASYRPQVPERVRKERADRLLTLSRQKRAAFASAQVGMVRSVLLEERLENGDWLGTSDNYLKERFAKDPLTHNPLLTHAITLGRHYSVRFHEPQGAEGMTDLEGCLVTDIQTSAMVLGALA